MEMTPYKNKKVGVLLLPVVHVDLFLFGFKGQNNALIQRENVTQDVATHYESAKHIRYYPPSLLFTRSNNKTLWTLFYR